MAFKKWRDLFSSAFLDKNLTCLVFDEVHLVSWGYTSPDSSTPFREAFSQIKELRSLCRSSCPLLALNAPVDCDLTELVKSSCSFTNFQILSQCVARSNICLHVIKLKNKSIEALKWIINGLVEFGVEAPKIVILLSIRKLCG